jgi:hypothetical protein
VRYVIFSEWIVASNFWQGVYPFLRRTECRHPSPRIPARSLQLTSVHNELSLRKEGKKDNRKDFFPYAHVALNRRVFTVQWPRSTIWVGSIIITLFGNAKQNSHPLYNCAGDQFLLCICSALERFVWCSRLARIPGNLWGRSSVVRTSTSQTVGLVVYFFRSLPLFLLFFLCMFVCI